MSLDLSNFYSLLKRQFKTGSLVLAVFIPILLLLSQFDFVRADFMISINQVLIIIALVEVSFKLFLHFFLDAKVEIAEINKEISEGRFTSAKQKVKNSAKANVSFAKETAKVITNAVKTVKKELAEKKESEAKVESEIKPKVESQEFIR